MLYDIILNILQQKSVSYPLLQLIYCMLVEALLM